VRDRVREDPLAGVPPYWRQLHQRVMAAGSDQARFRLLADLARQQREVPPAGDYLPPEIGLALREDELREWLRAQPPGVRGRMYRLMQGINALFPWPHHILQNEGKFDPLWLTLMMSAAERYIRALRADAQVIGLLRRDLAALPRHQREFLVTRMVGHAAAALDVETPEVRMLDKPLGAQESVKESGKEADTVFETPIKIRFYPRAFERGSINLVVTVFHEAIHAAQMELIFAMRDADAGQPRRPLTPDDSGRAAVLELSLRHLGDLSTQQRNDDHYYLYRHATEAEREAHVAELQAAMLAAACTEFNPEQDGTLARILTDAPVRDDGGACDPYQRVTRFIEQETGLDTALLGESAAAAKTSAQQSAGPTLYLLATRKQPHAAACARIAGDGGFASTAGILALRGESEPLAGVSSKGGPALYDTPASGANANAAAVRTAGTVGGAAIGALWKSLLKLEALRDPLDNADLLANALLSSAPRLFYGNSDETQFLRMVVVSALNATRTDLASEVRSHLERRFGCRFVTSPSPGQFARAANALRHAWYTYRSPLGRRILIEAAATAMGYSVPPGEKAGPEQRLFRERLRKAMIGAAHDVLRPHDLP
jgi:hypothetical protein